MRQKWEFAQYYWNEASGDRFVSFTHRKQLFGKSDVPSMIGTLRALGDEGFELVTYSLRSSSGAREDVHEWWFKRPID